MAISHAAVAHANGGLVRRFARAGTLLLVLTMAGVALAQDLGSLPAKEIPWRNAPMMEFMPVGIAARQPYVKPLLTFKVPDSDSAWRHLLFKKKSRDTREMVFVTLDLTSGVLKEHPALAGYEVLARTWVGGKLYFGGNLPARLIEYDPAADTLQDLGAAFDQSATLFRLAVAPDGTLALGGSSGPEVSLFDPKTGKIARFGRVGDAQHGYVYELAHDNDFIYAACRGSSPWQLVAVNKKTGEKKTILTKPVNGYINAGGQSVSTRDDMSNKEEPWKRYDLRDGQVVERAPDAAPAPPRPQPETPPQVLVDESPLNEGREEVILHYQNPARRDEWRQAVMPVWVSSEAIQEAVGLADGRIAAFSGPYQPMVVFDPKAAQGRQAPLPHLSPRCILAVGNIVYLSGYPGVMTVRYDPDRPVTPLTALPGVPAVPQDSKNANPRMLGQFGMSASEGGHIGVQIFHAADGRIYVCARRHRHYKGFDMVWHDPATDKTGPVQDEGFLNHLQVGWCALMDEGRKMIISTYVQPYDQLAGAPPDSAQLIVLDLMERRYLSKRAPLPGVRVLTGVAEVAPGKVVGFALDEKQETSFLYRYNLTAERLESVVRYKGSTMGVPGTTGLPGKGNDFQRAPDGAILSGMSVAAGQGVVLRIDPDTLDITAPARFDSNGLRYLLFQDNLYVGGAARLRRVTGPESLLAIIKPKTETQAK